MNKHYAWEGIQNNMLRVFVKLDIPYTADQKNSEDTMTENLMNAGLNRAGAILMNYIRIHLTDFERIESCRQKIEEIQKKGEMMYQKCSEDSCTAFIDFDIKKFLDAAGRDDVLQ
jgi:hypothetical protein